MGFCKRGAVILALAMTVALSVATAYSTANAQNLMDPNQNIQQAQRDFAAQDAKNRQEMQEAAGGTPKAPEPKAPEPKAPQQKTPQQKTPQQKAPQGPSLAETIKEFRENAAVVLQSLEDERQKLEDERQGLEEERQGLEEAAQQAADDANWWRNAFIALGIAAVLAVLGAGGWWAYQKSRAVGRNPSLGNSGLDSTRPIDNNATPTRKLHFRK